MADFFSKKARRAQEKVLQKLGKADETKDEAFDEHVSNFNKQQSESHKLQKEFKQYLSSLKDMKASAASLNEVITEVYDDEWGSYSELVSLLEDSKTLWNNLAQRLSEEVLSPFAVYQSQFHELKSRISKRGRKLIDFDAARHNLENVKQKGKADERKITQLEEEELVAKKIYEELNSQLNNELPAVYDSRIAFYVSTLQSYFATQIEFSKKIATVEESLNELVNRIIDERSISSKLSDSAPNVYIKDKSPAINRKQRDTFKPVTKKNQDKPSNPFGNPDDEDEDNGQGNPFGQDDEDEDMGAGNPFADEDDDKKPENPFGEDDNKSDGAGNPFGEDDDKKDDSGSGNPFGTDDKDSSKSNKNGNSKKPTFKQDDKSKKDSASKQSSTEKNTTAKSARSTKSSKKPAPARVLYQARAKSTYVATDADSLSFVKGETINIIGVDKTRGDDQEEWLVGIRCNDNVKGVFPASATERDTTL